MNDVRKLRDKKIRDILRSFFSILLLLAVVATVNAEVIETGAMEREQATMTDVRRAQEDWRRMSEVADSLFAKRRYEEAGEVMDSLLLMRSDDEHFNYLKGASLFYAGDVEAAKAYLNRAHDIAGAVFMMGDAVMREDDYEVAAEYYERVVAMTGGKGRLAEASKRRLRGVRNARAMSGRKVGVEILDSVVVGKADFFEYYDLSADAGQVFLVSGAEHKYDAPRTGYMAQRGDRMLFADTTAKGGTGLYQSNRLADGWGKRKPIRGNIGTSGEENFPFLSSDGMTLYFGSTRHGSIGGYDLFVSVVDAETGEWREPRQLPMPINSTWNDYLYAIDEASGEAWWASDRWQRGDSVVVYHYRIPEDESLSEGVRREEEERADSLPFLKNIASGAKENQVRKVYLELGNGVVYTDLRQFVSNTAMRLYNEAVDAERSFEKSRDGLAELRRSYAKETDKIKKDEIGRAILNAEKELRGDAGKKRAEILMERARQTELNALRNKK